MPKEINDYKDLSRDRRNANRGTERGRSIVRRSIEERGIGRSTVVDANGRIIAGHTATDAAEAAGKKLRVIPTTGDELIVHQRVDLDLERDAKARQLAYLGS